MDGVKVALCNRGMTVEASLHPSRRDDRGPGAYVDD